MPRILTVFFVAVVLAGLVSCSTWNGSRVRNIQQNLSRSQVVLQDAHFKNVGRVQGEAQAIYYFGVFGPNEQDLYSKAMADLEKKAGIETGSRALTRIAVDQKVVFGLFHHLRKITVSAMVVEFTE
ncbi:MAG: hypothetical protein JNM63_06935 [Spirochaetia bacterium]|nr:hypothetical protein [Spirochaetia bacterium]